MMEMSPTFVFQNGWHMVTPEEFKLKKEKIDTQYKVYEYVKKYNVDIYDIIYQYLYDRNVKT